MVRACRQPLTSSPEEMDAFTLVMPAIELERKKHDERVALKTTPSNYPETIQLIVPPPMLYDNERQLTDTPKP